MDADLIYDVGLHDGSDTRHYLDCGFRVIAVEANPAFVEAGRAQFTQEIADGRLVIVDSAIGAQAGGASFWVNDDNSEWSSLIEWEGTRQGTRTHVITVNCVTFDSLLARHGVPYYLKIDIERASSHCLEALSPTDRPAYVSIEAHTAGYLGMLSRLGYDEFKLIDQRTHLAIDGYTSQRRRLVRTETLREHIQGLRSLAVSVARHVPGARRAYRTLFNAAASEAVSPVVPARSFGASGPFAEDTDGRWRSLDDVAFDYLRLRSPENPAWYDFHARTGGRLRDGGSVAAG